LLRSGSLPVELRELESRLVGPTLGQQTLTISIYAAAAGLAAVLLYMILYYRLAGLISGVALLFYLTLVLGTVNLVADDPDPARHRRFNSFHRHGCRCKRDYL